MVNNFRRVSLRHETPIIRTTREVDRRHPTEDEKKNKNVRESTGEMTPETHSRLQTSQHPAGAFPEPFGKNKM